MHIKAHVYKTFWANFLSMFMIPNAISDFNSDINFYTDIGTVISNDCLFFKCCGYDQCKSSLPQGTSVLHEAS